MKTSLRLVKQPPQETTPSRLFIETLYYRDEVLVKRTLARWADNAVKNCTDHMQYNDYGATAAEVYDRNTGELHAVVTHSVQGHIEIWVQREMDREHRL